MASPWNSAKIDTGVASPSGGFASFASKDNIFGSGEKSERVDALPSQGDAVSKDDSPADAKTADSPRHVAMSGISEADKLPGFVPQECA